MAGLAIGNTIAASLRSHKFSPLYLYAALEVTIAVAGCTIVFGLPRLGEWMHPVFQMVWNHDSVLNAIRLVMSFAILLVPTTAMGLTLPVLFNDVGLHRHDFSRAIAILYGVNTLGAVAGALVSETYLVRAFGLWGTSLAAGIMNCAAAALAFGLAKYQPITDRIIQPRKNEIQST